MLSLLDLIEEPTERPRVCVYAGYSFGLILHANRSGFQENLSGIVVTPRWAARCAGELKLDAQGLGPVASACMDLPESEPLHDQEEAPSLSDRVILDNGAYPAWVSGTPLTLDEQLAGIHEALQLMPLAEWIIAPDVVADASATWERINASLGELQVYGLHRLLLPVQDGMELSQVAALARELDCGVFVGGSGWSFKHRAARALCAMGLRWVHVGRARTAPELEALARMGVDAVDSSSFLRAQHHNLAKRDIYRRTLNEWAHPRGTPTQEGHSARLPYRHAYTARSSA